MVAGRTIEVFADVLPIAGGVTVLNVLGSVPSSVARGRVPIYWGRFREVSPTAEPARHSELVEVQCSPRPSS